MANSHLNPELLSAYLDEEVSENERALVESHLATCEACQLELESLSWTVNLLHRLPEQPVPRTFYITEAMLEPEKPPLGNWFEWLRSLLSVRGALATVAAALLLMVVIQSSPFFSPSTDSQSIALMVAEPTAALEQNQSIAVAPQSSAPETGTTLAEEAPVEQEGLSTLSAEDDSTPELALEEEIQPAAADAAAAEAEIVPQEADVAAAEMVLEEAESGTDIYALEQEADAAAADGETMRDESAANYAEEAEVAAESVTDSAAVQQEAPEAEGAAEAESAAETGMAPTSPATRGAERLISTPEALATQALVPASTPKLLTPSEATAEPDIALKNSAEEEATSDTSAGSQERANKTEDAPPEVLVEPSQAPQMMLIATGLLLLLIAGVILWCRRPQS